MIEMIVVVILLALFASMVVPRFTHQKKRQFELMVDGLTDLLSMYAQRDQLVRQPVGILLDIPRRQFLLVILDTDSNQPDEPARWRSDHDIKPVSLPEFLDLDRITVLENGDQIDISQWPLANRIGESRSNLELVIEGPEDTISLVLPSYAITPYRMDSTHSYYSGRTIIDLDEEGRAMEDW